MSESSQKEVLTLAQPAATKASGCSLCCVETLKLQLYQTELRNWAEEPLPPWPPDIDGILEAKVVVVVSQEVTNGGVIPAHDDRVGFGLEGVRGGVY